MHANIVMLEKRIESMKSEREMLNQALTMLKEKVATLSSQPRAESPSRMSANHKSIKSAVLVDEAALKQMDEECHQKLMAMKEIVEKALREKDLVLGDLDRKQDQVVSLKGDCKKFNQTLKKALKEKEKMKTLVNELNKTVIEQGNELYDLK